MIYAYFLFHQMILDILSKMKNLRYTLPNKCEAYQVLLYNTQIGKWMPALCLNRDD